MTNHPSMSKVYERIIETCKILDDTHKGKSFAFELFMDRNGGAHAQFVYADGDEDDTKTWCCVDNMMVNSHCHFILAYAACKAALAGFEILEIWNKE